ncbi:MAG TPA: pyridoxal-dependent decarboxylase [Candidatus Acidoferrales bacterium]|jgi:glutamate/tyrosine decarboxylase-like PLP-dependent enzyme|nr:pyridoxal-dependent decarboxylase [Candidatus Acidoferrales bacterium]
MTVTENMLFDAVRSALERVESEIASGPIVPSVTPGEIRAHLKSCYDFSKPGDLDAIGADVQRMLRSGNVQVTHPRYFGLFNPSVTTPAVLADLLVAMYNPQLAAWRTAPAANEVERHTLLWLAAKFGFPANTAATFTSGGAEANLTAVIAALTKSFPGYGDHGLRSLKVPPALYVTGQAHTAIHKIAHVTGLGRSAVRTVAVDGDLKMDLVDLAKKVAEDRRNGLAPFMVIGTAGTTGAGVIDPLPELAAFCQAESLWFHADAAWGGAAIISPRLRSYLAGIEAADSITCDAHKWFSVPMGAGMFFCRHPEAIAEAFRANNTFMPGHIDEGGADPYTMSLQWSRRFMGLKFFFALAQFGESGYANLIEHQTRMGQVLRESLVREGWRVINKTPLPVVCFTRYRLDIPKFVASLVEHQIVWMSTVQIDDAPAIRACITSYRTQEADIADVVQQMNRFVKDAA